MRANEKTGGDSLGDSKIKQALSVSAPRDKGLLTQKAKNEWLTSDSLLETLIYQRLQLFLMYFWVTFTLKPLYNKTCFTGYTLFDCKFTE